MNIEKLDKNFKIESPSHNGLKYHNAMSSPMQIFGLAWFEDNKEYIRIPTKLFDKFSEGVCTLATNTSGVNVRFKTNSSVIAIKATLLNDTAMNHMTRVGSAGFDVYVNGEFKGIAVSSDESKYIDCTPASNLGNEEKEITINFPLYNGVEDLFIGLDNGSTLSSPIPYKSDKPIVFYGSSITQGGCASRPGNSYTTMISRHLDIPVINLGFSGNAKGEPQMAELISQIDMCCFVYDYDHNSPSPEHLKQTHQPFFEIIRKSHPDIPIVIISKADHCDDIKNIKRKDIIYDTYKNAVSSGDNNVYFIDGKEIYTDENSDACTVDGCHPNDLGFYRMYKAICPVIESALNSKNSAHRK